jgi:hypothetical protein
MGAVLRTCSTCLRGDQALSSLWLAVTAYLQSRSCTRALTKARVTSMMCWTDGHESPFNLLTEERLRWSTSSRSWKRPSAGQKTWSSTSASSTKRLLAQERKGLTAEDAADLLALTSRQRKPVPNLTRNRPCGRVVIHRACAHGIPQVGVDQSVDPGFRDDGVWGTADPSPPRSGWRSAVDRLSWPKS